MALTPYRARQYRTLRLMDIPAARAYVTVKGADELTAWSREHITDGPGDALTLSIDGASYRVEIERDDFGGRPEDYGDYTGEDILAWEEDLWHYAVVTVTRVTEAGDDLGSVSLGGIDIGYYFTTTGATVMDEQDQVLALVADQRLWAEADADSPRVLAEVRERLARMAASI